MTKRLLLRSGLLDLRIVFGVLVLSLGSAAVFAVAWAQSDGETITQIRQSFDPPTVNVAQGAVVHFINADDVNHNLYLTEPGGKQTDYGLDKPGQATDVPVGAPGTYIVRCHIHPRMKETIVVK